MISLFVVRIVPLITSPCRYSATVDAESRAKDAKPHCVSWKWPGLGAHFGNSLTRSAVGNFSISPVTFPPISICFIKTGNLACLHCSMRSTAHT